MAHQLVPRIPADVLTIRPVADGESIGVLAWTVAGSYVGHLSRTRGQAASFSQMCGNNPQLGANRPWYVQWVCWHGELG